MFNVQWKQPAYRWPRQRRAFALGFNQCWCSHNTASRREQVCASTQPFYVWRQGCRANVVAVVTWGLRRSSPPPPQSALGLARPISPGKVGILQPRIVIWNASPAATALPGWLPAGAHLSNQTLAGRRRKSTKPPDKMREAQITLFSQL